MVHVIFQGFVAGAQMNIVPFIDRGFDLESTKKNNKASTENDGANGFFNSHVHHMDVSKNRGTPEWMVHNEKPY